MSEVVSGNAHKHLLDYIGATASFPLVNKLAVEIPDYKDQHYDAEVIAFVNARRFAKLLKAMAPAATTIELVCHHENLQSINNNDDLGGDLDEEILVVFANVLRANTKSAHLDLVGTSLKNPSTIDLTPLLSSLNLNCENSPDVHASLMWKSASTLQQLVISIQDANMLTYDVHGKAVVYPNLQYLQMFTLVRNYSNP
ncbi:hypothetical protein LPJ71_003526, partial [Coemansia sp. S17]